LVYKYLITKNIPNPSANKIKGVIEFLTKAKIGSKYRIGDQQYISKQ
jgi:hypothetical protein